MERHDDPASTSGSSLVDDSETDEPGLSAAEAARRLEEYGPNEFVEGERRGPVDILLDQFRSVLIWVLVAAALVAAFVGDPVDAALIMAIVVANGLFGFAQDYRAESSLRALRELAAPTATVLRDGEPRTIPATEVVPGDVLVLTAGDAVPADAELVTSSDLAVDEAALTGESVPVSKEPADGRPADGQLADSHPTDGHPAEGIVTEREDLVFKQTTVVRGSGRAVVYATGMETQVGEIAAELGTVDAGQTPLQTDLDAFGRTIGVAVLGLATVVGVVLVAGGAELVRAALTAISLAVAAVPEGLPAVVTLTLALGVRRMADQNALVRRLPAVESLGSVDVVATDKTGTVTKGKMTVTRAWADGREFEPGAVEADDEVARRLFEIGAVCNDATHDHGDPTEVALVEAAAAAGVDPNTAREARPRRSEHPFSSERRRMATVHDDHSFVKGAPETVLERSTRLLTASGPVDLDDAARARIRSRVDDFADDALRVLGFAYGDPSDPESDLVFVGVQGMQDPPREEVADAIARTRAAGIDVKLITGDDRRTASVIGAQVGLGGDVVTGSDLEGMDERALRRVVETHDVFARVLPTHKVDICRALQENGHTVAMTGDGVNDAPALKHADVGISMGQRGTEVAKQASDLVLLDDNYATITAAIRNGRTIFDNVWKFVAYLLSANLAEVVLVFVASLFGYLVLPPAQLLWINLLTDGLPAVALGVDPESGDVMDRPPRDRDEGILDGEMKRAILGIGLSTSVVMLALTAWLLSGDGSGLPAFAASTLGNGFADSTSEYVVTMVFTTFVVVEFVKLFAVRWIPGHTEWNPWLVVAVAGSMILQLAVLSVRPLQEAFHVVPLGVVDWLVVLGTAAVAGVPMVVVVWLLRRRESRNETGRDPTS
ncbi:cation-translocating P-type ATPase [Haloarchaeobius sp. TZWWS8]|uniref:cation-translocating P-type ATPase n=1 Tax=Haloarchaeobius sp. TZWWS8 TaxID=3446121 RepID=UPI003EBD1450